MNGSVLYVTAKFCDGWGENSMLECLTTNSVAERTGNDEFLTDVLRGLSKTQKQLPCKYFYDRRGSQLFDAICEQPEYYVTRTELAIMREYAREMAFALGDGVTLIEFGSGSSIKTELLLNQLRRPAVYVPIDISGQHLEQTASRLRRTHPKTKVLPVIADFTQPFDLPRACPISTRRAVYFPGSTIGNFEPLAAFVLLKQIANTCGSGGALLIGIDLRKNVRVIEEAYNDAAGVTAEFNLNLLQHANNKLDAHFDLDNFSHRARYDTRHHRVDIRLVSQCRQRVHVNGIAFDFEKHETIHTEYSHKYSLVDFANLASHSGFQLRKFWTDSRRYFAVLYFVLGEDAHVASEEFER